MILCIYWQPHNMNSIVHVVISHYMRPHILDKPKRHTAFGWIHAIFWLWNMQKTSQQFRVPACKHIPPSVWGLSSNLGWRHPNCHHNLDTHTHTHISPIRMIMFYDFIAHQLHCAALCYIIFLCLTSYKTHIHAYPLVPIETCIIILIYVILNCTLIILNHIISIYIVSHHFIIVSSSICIISFYVWYCIALDWTAL